MIFLQKNISAYALIVGLFTTIDNRLMLEVLIRLYYSQIMDFKTGS